MKAYFKPPRANISIALTEDSSVILFLKHFPLLISVILLSAAILLILNVNAQADMREVRVGVYANKPLVYQDENGEYQGLSIDVLRFAASKENWKLEFVPCSWSEGLDLLKRGETDIQVIIAKTPERSKFYDFTNQSLYSLWAQIFIHPDSDIHSWTDLQGKNVAVYKDDFFSETFKKLIGEFGIDSNLLEVENYQAMLKLIKEKKADAGVFIQTFAEQYAVRGIVRRTPIMFNPVPIYYAFPKGKVPELVAALDRHLEMLKKDKDSIYYHSLGKIFSQEREWTIPRWIKWILIVVPSLMLLSLIISVILKKQVTAKTAELSLRATELEKEIRERKQADEALYESEAKFRAIASAANDAIIMIDQEDKITFWNESASNILGFTRDEVTGQNLHELIIPERFRQQYLQAAPRFRETGQGVAVGKTTALSATRKGGVEFPVEISLSSVRLDDKWHAVGILRDVTERKRVEDELKESEEKYRTILESIEEGYFEVNLAGRFTFFSNYMTEMYGYSLGETVGMCNRDYMTPDSAKYVYKNFNQIYRTGKPATKIRCEIIRKDGEHRFHELSASLLKDRAGQPIGFRGIARDITEREQAQIELQESEARLRSVLNTANDAIVTIDVSGKVIFWNPGAEKTFNYSSSEIIGQPVTRLIPERFREAHKTGLDRAVSIAETRVMGETIELAGLKKNGDEFPMELSISTWVVGKQTFFTGIMRDITDRKKMEIQFLQAQKLEAIGKLATGIAHEINTPTQYIYVNIEFLQDAFEKLAGVANQVPRILEAMRSGASNDDLVSEYEGTVKEAGLDYITEEIPDAINGSLDGVNRISEIVESMRYFAHPGKKDRVTFDVNQALKEAITLSRNEWKYYADNVMDLDPSLMQIQGFPAEFSQVLLNLIINAAQAITGVVGETPKVKGTITTSTCNKDDWIEVRIGDTGPGIPEEVRSKIFDPFFTTKEVGQGTGQGLAIAHSVIVEKHNGSIDFETETGKGTTFILRLPVKPDPILD